MSKKRPTEVGATRGGPHHAPRLRPDQCMLCRQVGHRASECPNKGKPTAFSHGKRAFGTYALGCAVFDSQCYGATVEEIEQDQDEEGIEDVVAFSVKITVFSSAIAIDVIDHCHTGGALSVKRQKTIVPIIV